MNLRDIGRQPLKWLMIVSICFLFFHSFPSFASAVSKSLNGPKSGKSSDTGEYIVKFHEGAMRKAAMQLAGNNEATRSQGSDRPMLIRLKPDAEQDMLERLAADPRLNISSRIFACMQRERLPIHITRSNGAWTRLAPPRRGSRGSALPKWSSR